MKAPAISLRRNAAALASPWQVVRRDVLAALESLYWTHHATRAGLNAMGDVNLSEMERATGANRAHVRRFMRELGLKATPRKRRKLARKAVEK